MNDFSTLIQQWYRLNKRELPWRNTKNPYFIWLSEIILQQTQVVQGLDYYNKFVNAFPSIDLLAEASEDDVLKMWQGLGYYSRARNLHFSAKQIHNEHKGAFPNTYHEIIKLKGVGEYTAAAIASFAYGLPHAVVDGNVFRVLSRIFNLSTPINSTQGKKEFNLLADELLDQKNPAIHNQAIMELGALVCKPKNPSCDICPVSMMCDSKQKGNQQLLPVKLKKTKVKQRYLNYIINISDHKVLLKKRSNKDIWKGLYEFPLKETAESVKSMEGYELDHKVNHILTHQKLEVSFWVKHSKPDEIIKNYEAFDINDLVKCPVPQVIANYINTSALFNQ